jgi:urea transport system ATP-binding protein
MAILLVEQFYDFAAELADSYLLMSRGTIIQRGGVKTWSRRAFAGWLRFEML